MLHIVASYNCMQFQVQRKLMNQIWENEKNLVLGPILVYLAQIRAAIFFFFFSKIWLRQSLDIMVSHHHVQLKKLMIQSWENLVTNGRRTDESDFIGRHPINVERPKVNCKI